MDNENKCRNEKVHYSAEKMKEIELRIMMELNDRMLCSNVISDYEHSCAQGKIIRLLTQTAGYDIINEEDISCRQG